MSYEHHPDSLPPDGFILGHFQLHVIQEVDATLEYDK